MCDFMKEIKLSHNAYCCWQEIKSDIKLKMETDNNKVLLCTFDSNDLMVEVTNFLINYGFKVYIGERVWQEIPTGYDIEGFKHYCKYNFDGDNFIKREKLYIPCVIKW